MMNCAKCEKKMIVKIIMTILNLKASEVAKVLHVSESLVSKYLAGERNSVELDIFLIEKIFAIKIKEYSKYEKA